MIDPAKLLHDLRPILRMDSRDRWRPGSAALLVTPGNLCCPGDDGLLVERPPLSYLAPHVYPTGRLALSRDYIAQPGDMRRQVKRMVAANPALLDLVYGHVVEDGPDVWLQWWMAYPRNDTPLTLGRGSHAADWERLAVLLRDGRPVLAVGSQHRAAEIRDWPNVEQHDGRPVVYPRLGTHAVAFEPGWKWLGGSFDICNGKRVIDPAVEVLTPDETPWMNWPGLWGDVTTGHVIRGPMSHRTPALLAASGRRNRA